MLALHRNALIESQFNVTFYDLIKKYPHEKCSFIFHKVTVKNTDLCVTYSTWHKDTYTYYIFILQYWAWKKLYLSKNQNVYILFIFTQQWALNDHIFSLFVLTARKLRVKFIALLMKQIHFKFLIHLFHSSVNWILIFLTIVLIFIVRVI